MRLHFFALATVSSFATAPSAMPRSVAPGKIEITLERSGCLGFCPIYGVKIKADGQVIFTSDGRAGAAAHRKFALVDGVLLPGTHSDRVGPGAVAALVQQFQAAHFWQLKGEYGTPVADAPSYRLTVSVGRKRKSVVDYTGDRRGIPKSIAQLEDAIDKLADTDRWVLGTLGLIPWLERTHFDFRSRNAAELAATGEMAEASEAMIIALIDRGAPLEQFVVVGGSSPIAPVDSSNLAGMTIIEASIRRGHAAVFNRLADRGWLDRLGKVRAAQIFAEQAAGCSPAMVDAIADAGIDIDHETPPTANMISNEATGKTSLGELAQSYACNNDEAARSKTAERLLARGADPNHRDSLGRTPLYGIESGTFLNVLLAHGGDPRTRSIEGNGSTP